MNVAVINGKDILRYLLIVLTGLMISFFIFKGIRKEEKEVNVSKVETQKIEILEKIDGKKLIGIELPLLNSKQADKVETEHKNIDFIKTIFSSQVAMIEHVKSKEENNIVVEQEEIDLATTGEQTAVVEENNITETYTNESASVKVKNQTDFDITNELTNPEYQFDNKTDILIFHTHTCESYTPTETYNYQMSGSYRTTDLNYTVARVGDELNKQLTAYGFHVTHDKTYHDYPAYTGSYGRSLETVQNLLSNSTSAQMVIDLHRDAVGSNSDYAPTVQIGEEYAAQLMFVMGSDGGGLQHPDWRQNFSMAVKIQQKANELYPGLFRPIILRNSRYNQHLTKGACIIEVGATGNTMEQCLTSMKYLSKVLHEVINE